MGDGKAMKLGGMQLLSPESADERCKFCKSIREIKPRCTNCQKLLAIMLSSPYIIVCGRCKQIRTG